MQLADVAEECGISTVVSSAFDGDIGLSYDAMLASVLSNDSTSHGLGTYERFDEHVASTSPGARFRGLPSVAGGGARIHIDEVEALLDGVGDALLAQVEKAASMEASTGTRVKTEREGRRIWAGR